MSPQNAKRPFGWLIGFTVILAAIGYSIVPYGPESRAGRHHVAAQQWLNTISGACVGAALGLSINLVHASLRKSQPRQYSMQSLFAMVFSVAMICAAVLWYRSATSTYWSYPSDFVRWLAEWGG